MATVKWTALSAASNLLTTELNSLSSGSRSGLGTEYDNTSNLYQFCDIELVLASDVTAGATQPYVKLYLVPCTDGTNYPNPPSGTGVIPEVYYIGSITANASATFRRGVLRSVVIPPSKFKIGVESQLGVALPAASNIAKVYFYNEQGV